MSKASALDPQSDVERLELAADQAIAICGGDAREVVKAPIVPMSSWRRKSRKVIFAG